MSGSSGSNDESVSRRRIMQAMGAASAASLAGCLGDDEPEDSEPSDSEPSDSEPSDSEPSDDEPELGERVPEPLLVEYWSGGSATTIVEDFAPTQIEAYQNALDHEVEYVPVEFTTQINNVIEEERTHHVASWWHSSTPSRLDPQEMIRRFSIDWAGGNSRANPVNWANCLYSEYAVGQEQAPDPTTRTEMVWNAAKIASEEYVQQPIMPQVFYGFSDPRVIDVGGLGNMGATRTNPHMLIQSTPVDGDEFTYVGVTDVIETTHYPVHDSSSVNAWWNSIYTSPLMEYDETFDLQPVMASGFESENEGQRYVVELREGAQWHNGDPVTADDVVFTFTQLWDHGVGHYPHGAAPPYTSIEATDELTATFEFEVPFPSLVSREWPRWGLMHKESWEAGNAHTDPGGFEPDPTGPNPGAGPFQIVDFEYDQFIDIEPHPHGHPVHEVDHNVHVRVMRDDTTRVEAALSGEAHLGAEIAPGAVERLVGEDSEFDDHAQAGFLPFVVYPQYGHAPGKFFDFRRALTHAADRELANEVALRGDSVAYNKGHVFSVIHPSYPTDNDDFLVDIPTTPEPDTTKEILREAGWGWDDDGNLRYPADADLSDRWGQHEVPDPADYECLNSEGEFESQYTIDELLEMGEAPSP